MCTEAEVDYFIDLVRYVLPDITVDRDRIVYRFAGVRPLPGHGDLAPGFVSRDYRIEAAPLAGRTDATVLSLVGGKWTTFRASAEHLADRALELLARPRRRSTKGVPIGGGRGFPTTERARRQWIAAHGEGLGRDRVATLLDRYGTVAADVIAAIADDPDDAAARRRCPSYSTAELRHLARTEDVVHLDDVLHAAHEPRVHRRGHRRVGARGRRGDRAGARVGCRAAPTPRPTVAWRWCTRPTRRGAAASARSSARDSLTGAAARLPRRRSRALTRGGDPWPITCWRSIREPPRRGRSSSTRSGGIVAVAQREHEQIFPRAGWVEHDPVEIWTNTAVGDRGRAATTRGSAPRDVAGGRHHQSARDGDRLGPPHRPPGRQRARVAGHPHAAAHRPARRRRRHRPLRRDDRPAAGDLLLGIQDRLDPRQRPRRARRRRSRAPAVRHARHVADLEPHRRHARRHPRHRRHERQPHAADGPRDARLVRRAARGVRHPARR